VYVYVLHMCFTLFPFHLFPFLLHFLHFVPFRLHPVYTPWYPVIYLFTSMTPAPHLYCVTYGHGSFFGRALQHQADTSVAVDKPSYVMIHCSLTRVRWTVVRWPKKTYQTHSITCDINLVPLIIQPVLSKYIAWWEGE